MIHIITLIIQYQVIGSVFATLAAFFAFEFVNDFWPKKARIARFLSGSRFALAVWTIGIAGPIACMWGILLLVANQVGR